MTCLGCQLANGQIETQIVYENELLTCFLDYNPYNEGHLLLLPKRHIAEITECSQIEVEAIFEAIKLLSQTLNIAVVPDGITVLQNGGIFNDLTHLHIHIVPRYQGQNFADFYIEEDAHIEQQKEQLPLTKAMLIDVLKNLSNNS